MTAAGGIEVTRPRSLAAALAAMRDEPGAWRPLAGGTDLMVGIEAGVDRPARVLDLWGLEELRGIRDEGDALELGALTTGTDIIRSPLVARACDTLIAASREVGAIAIQNRGTIGGNVANASPAADTVPVLVAMGATLVLASAEGRREVPIGRFYLGYKKLDLRGDELLVAVRVPRRRDGEVLWFRKVGTRRAQSISKVVLAGRARPRYGPGGACVLESLSLAAGSVGPTVLALRGAEAAAIGRPLDDDALRQIRTAVGNDVTPIDDVRSTSEYRRTVAENLVVRWLGELRKAGVAKGSA